MVATATDLPFDLVRFNDRTGPDWGLSGTRTAGFAYILLPFRRHGRIGRRWQWHSEDITAPCEAVLGDN